MTPINTALAGLSGLACLHRGRMQRLAPTTTMAGVG